MTLIFKKGEIRRLTGDGRRETGAIALATPPLRHLVTPLLRYFVTSLLRYIATPLLRYFVTSLHRFTPQLFRTLQNKNPRRPKRPGSYGENPLKITCWEGKTYR